MADIETIVKLTDENDNAVELLEEATWVIVYQEIPLAGSPYPRKKGVKMRISDMVQA